MNVTLPDSSSAWVSPTHVVEVMHAPKGMCVGGAPTVIDLDSGKFVCVLESPEEIIRSLKAGQ